MARESSKSSNQLFRNAAQTLLANIQFASVDAPLRSIVVTSAVPNEGKTTIAIELARAMASAGLQTLLVECDMRRRTLAGKLNAHLPNGLYAALAKKVPFSECYSTIEDHLMFIDSEPHIPNPPSLISSERFQEFHDFMCEQFDYIVFDTPPVTAFVDAAVLSSIADGTVLVIRERFAKKQEVQSAYDQLVKAGANVVGVAMNCCKEEKGSYYYSYYENGMRRRSSRKRYEEPSVTETDDAALQDYQPLPVSPRTRGGGSRSKLRATKEGDSGDA